MPDPDREFKVRFTADASSLVEQSRQSADALGEVSRSAKKNTQANEDGSKAADKHAMSHRALHLLLRQVGQGSKEAELAMTALSGVMMGSTMFGVYALAEGVRLLGEHFRKVKDAALEEAHVITTMWTSGLDQAAEARKAMENYSEALDKAASGHNALAQKEAQDQALLKNEIALRKELLETMMQAELAQAKGDKDEEERIRQRYGHQKQEVDLQAQMIELLHQRRVVDERSADAEEKRQAARLAAMRIKVAPDLMSPSPGESKLAEEWLAQNQKSLDTAQVARLKPADLESLRTEVERRKGEEAYIANPSGNMTITRAGAAREELDKAEKAEAAYSGLQQEFERNRAIVETFHREMDRLNKAAAEATQKMTEAANAEAAAQAEVAKLEALYQQNRDALRERQAVQAVPIIRQAGFEPSPLAQSAVHDIWSLMGTARGERMSGGDTEMVNALLNGIATVQHARGQSDQRVTQLINRLVAEIRDPHVELTKKLQDVLNALHQRPTNLLPGAG